MWTEVADGGAILFAPDFLSETEADQLFAKLVVDAAWRQERSIWGHMAPRLTAYYADPSVDYRYSGVTHEGVGWPENLTWVKDRIEKQVEESFNSVLLNLYRDGDDSMGFHADDEKELGENPTVPSLSLGATRSFVLRHKKSKQKLTYQLTHGSLLVMAGSLQHFWKHAIPKTKAKVGQRINLTFRKVRTDGG